MAKSKNPNKGEGKEGGIDSLDDIELLNLYKYPEFYSNSLLNELKNSRSAQRRLEELLAERPSERKTNSDRAYRKSVDEKENNSLQLEKSGEKSGDPPTVQSSMNDFVKYLKKLIP